MAKQSMQGKAFEYACLTTLYEHFSRQQTVEIENSSSVRSAKVSYESISTSDQLEMRKAAAAAVVTLARLEPQLSYAGKNKPLYLTIQKDVSGEAGDVRDVLAIRQQNDWEIGISVKHNHDAVKHSRLSNTIDFGLQWFRTPCSSDYFATIGPIFQELSNLRDSSIMWRDLENKEGRFYVPILNAFKEELLSLYALHGSLIPQELMKYLLGRVDFYKLIADTKRKVTKLQAFSFFGTLNNPAGKVRPMHRIPQVKLPEVIHSVDFKAGSKTTLLIVCDEGWQLSARIHNASSAVEPSLKFDIKLIGQPPTVYSHDEPWGEFAGYGIESFGDLVAEETRKSSEETEF